MLMIQSQEEKECLYLLSANANEHILSSFRKSITHLNNKIVFRIFYRRKTESFKDKEKKKKEGFNKIYWRFLMSRKDAIKS